MTCSISTTAITKWAWKPLTLGKLYIRARRENLALDRSLPVWLPTASTLWRCQVTVLSSHLKDPTRYSSGTTSVPSSSLWSPLLWKAKHHRTYVCRWWYTEWQTPYKNKAYSSGLFQAQRWAKDLEVLLNHTRCISLPCLWLRNQKSVSLIYSFTV